MVLLLLRLLLCRRVHEVQLGAERLQRAARRVPCCQARRRGDAHPAGCRAEVLLRAQRLHAERAGQLLARGGGAKVLHRTAQGVHAERAGELLSLRARAAAAAKVLLRAQGVEGRRARQLLLRGRAVQAAAGRRRLPQLLLRGAVQHAAAAVVLLQAQRVQGRRALEGSLALEGGLAPQRRGRVQVRRVRRHLHVRRYES